MTAAERENPDLISDAKGSRVHRIARDAGIGEAPSIGHAIGPALVDRKPDRLLQIHADGGEHLQPRSGIAFTLDDIDADGHLAGRERAGDRSPAKRF